ncbi:IclR family transcriptional regulator [Rahnella ecdela]|jgi:DNA-binding IclR family transcriptional regulator|uniref:IclR family transcriptional regulator n=1 Tax=Rahnella ecdela TaxID=2816250 RepID=A0ABS6LC09_9GAMM|nr:IclR family transcriptional regulator [Rahnella ecdela]MBU9844400.1 IclR family transcriptional regulator [Rahnella ecdela]
MTQENEDQSPQQRRARTSGIDRAIQVLDLLQQQQQSLTCYEMAKAVGAPLSTIYSVVDDLVNKSMLERQKNGLIWLGPRLYYYGLSYGRNLDLLTVATQEMENLSQQCGEVIQICGRDDDKMVVLAMAEGRDHFHVASRVGTRIPLNWSASGRLLVGHLSLEERLALFTTSAPPSPTGKAETDPQRLAQSAFTALEHRLSIQANESDFSVACIASPICDSSGACRATISIVVPASKVDQTLPDLRALAQNGAKMIETRLGWRPLLA